MNFSYNFLRLGAALMLTSVSVFSFARSDVYASLNEFIDPLYPASEPGVSLIITKNGQAVYEKYLGMANLEHEIPIEPDSVFRIGSMTKQFAAVATMMLVEEGKLRLQDDVTKHLPEYKKPATRITVEHLLTHTSGIPNFTAIDGWMTSNKIRLKYSHEEMMSQWSDMELEFEPGTQFSYSNSAYYMLGVIVENVSGLSFADFIEQRMFEPLGMESSFYDYSERIIPKRVSGYSPAQSGGVENAPFLDMGQPFAAGSLASTVRDLAKWDAALYGEELLSAESLQKMWTPYILKDGSSTGYGYGWFITEYRGLEIVSHTGGIFGFNSAGIRIPEEGLYVAAITNGASSPLGIVAVAAAKALIDAPFSPEHAVQLDDPDAYVGAYTSADGATYSILKEDDGSLALETAPEYKRSLVPVGDEVFLIEGSAWELEFIKTGGSVEFLHLLTMGMPPTKFQRVND